MVIFLRRLEDADEIKRDRPGTYSLGGLFMYCNFDSVYNLRCALVIGGGFPPADFFVILSCRDAPVLKHLL